jgi:hypothetical protein
VNLPQPTCQPDLTIPRYPVSRQQLATSPLREERQKNLPPLIVKKLGIRQEI